MQPLLARYLSNLEALYRVEPELAARVDALPFTATPALEPTRDGSLTLRLATDDGKSIYAHSRYTPLDEARTLVEAQCKRPAKAAPERETEDADVENLCFMVTGLGLGYQVAEIERRFSRPIVIVAEDDLALIKTALCVADLASLMKDRRLAWLTAPDKAQLHERLRPVMTPLMLGLKFVSLPYVQRRHVSFFTQISALLRDFVAYARLQMISLVRNARITCKNILNNLPHYVSRPGVEALANCARGYPAILVAAGPSLARNIDQLGPLRERAVLIAVQTVLKTLLARDVPPHFVTSLDYHEISAEFFRGVADFGGTILVAEPKVTWHVPDTFRGPVHMLHSSYVDDLLREAAPPRAHLRAGSTVAHLAFYLAEHLGCDPVILVGQDLSFSEGLYYPPGMPIERIWQPELGRFSTIEMKQWERIVRSRAMLRTVKDIHGRDTYTDDQMYTYAEQFQSDFVATSTRVIHACEGGMRLAGTEIMTLREAAERFCTRPLPPDVFARPAPPAAASRAAVCAALEQRLRELQSVREIAQETLKLLEKMMGLVTRPAEFNRLVTRVDELRTRMERNDRTYNLVSQVAQLAELRRIHADRAIRDEQDETPETARRRLRRDQQFVAAFLEGCDFLLDALPRAIERASERLL